MIMTIKTRYIISTVFVAILAIFIIGGLMGYKRGKSASTPLINALTDQIVKYEVELKNSKLYVAEKEQELLSVREAKRQGDLTNEELRKLNIKQAKELTRLKLQVDTLLEDIDHTGQVIYVDRIVKDSLQKAIKLPFTFQKKDEWLDLKGSFNNDAKLDIALKVNANVDVWVVQKKREKTPSVLITTTNPYIGVIGIQSQKYDIQRKKRFGLGGLFGYGINLTGQGQVNYPFIGVGLSYDFLQF